MDGIYAGSIVKPTDAENAQQQRVATSADYLGEHMGEAPALVIACSAAGRVDGAPAMMAASLLGNVLPAMWSFMLAARARGLGTAWTTIHLMMEQQVADVVGIPFAEVQQVCLSPLAHTVGTDFKPATAPRPRHRHPLGPLVAAFRGSRGVDTTPHGRQNRQGSRSSWTRLLVSQRLPPRCSTWA